MLEIKLDALKERAKKLVSQQMRNDSPKWHGYQFRSDLMITSAMVPAMVRAIEDAGAVPKMASPEAKIEDVLKEWESAAHKVIDDWDVRQVGRLVKLFPSIVPKEYQKTRIVAELVDDDAGEECEWMCFFGGREEPRAA